MDSICDILKNKGINGIVYGASLRLAFSSSSDMETFVDHLQQSGIIVDANDKYVLIKTNWVSDINQLDILSGAIMRYTN